MVLLKHSRARKWQGLEALRSGVYRKAVPDKVGARAALTVKNNIVLDERL